MPAATDVESTVSLDWAGPYGETGAVTVDTGQAANAVAALRVEVWPARVVEGTMLFGSTPLVTEGRRRSP